MDILFKKARAEIFRSLAEHSPGHSRVLENKRIQEIRDFLDEIQVRRAEVALLNPGQGFKLVWDDEPVDLADLEF